MTTLCAHQHGHSRRRAGAPEPGMSDERAGGQPAGGRLVLSSPEGPSCSLGNLMFRVKCVCFRISEKKKMTFVFEKCRFLERKNYDLFFFVLYQRSQPFLGHTSSACGFICTWHLPGPWSDWCFPNGRSALRLEPSTLSVFVGCLLFFSSGVFHFV